MMLALIQMEFDGYLQEMAKSLPSEYRLTLVARNTTRPDSDIVMTRDDLREVSRVVLTFAKDEPTTAQTPKEKP